MSILAAPQSRAPITFLRRPTFHKKILGFGFVLALAMANTGCATLDPMAAASGQSLKPITVSAIVPMATVGSSYNAPVHVSGGTAPYVFTAKMGRVPPGLSV